LPRFIPSVIICHITANLSGHTQHQEFFMECILLCVTITGEFYSPSPQQIFTRIFVLLHVSVPQDHHQAKLTNHKNHFHPTSEDLFWCTLKYSICVNRFSMCVVWVYSVCVMCLQIVNVTY
jgi:hypothetical protein